ncbi:MAG TPA: hypothetical protein VEJ68_05120 [Candidatus Bathyarchaeia archaeon]|nr:hypothetical protein [Candidatus Bathyarchaeia archaeon]
MSDEELFAQVSQHGKSYVLHVDDKIFNLEKISLVKSTIPVRKPTTRGGVYFTDTTAYKMKAITHDLSIIELLPNLMLGPNTEFKSIEIKTVLDVNGTQKEIILETHVANTMNTKDTVELNLIVDKIRLD